MAKDNMEDLDLYGELKIEITCREIECKIWD